MHSPPMMSRNLYSKSTSDREPGPPHQITENYSLCSSFQAYWFSWLRWTPNKLGITTNYSCIVWPTLVTLSTRNSNMLWTLKALFLFQAFWSIEIVDCVRCPQLLFLLVLFGFSCASDKLFPLDIHAPMLGVDLKFSSASGRFQLSDQVMGRIGKPSQTNVCHAPISVEKTKALFAIWFQWCISFDNSHGCKLIICWRFCDRLT